MAEMEAACPTTLKGKFYSAGRKLLDRQDPTETFLSHMPLHAKSFELLAPDFLCPDLVRAKFKQLLLERPKYHRKLLAGSAAIMPFTSTVFTLLPGPNVFFLWNAYRAYVHKRAFAGACHLVSIAPQAACPEANRAAMPLSDSSTSSSHSPSASGIICRCYIRTKH
jgi:Mitochondrial K+-H+ exchange-related